MGVMLCHMSSALMSSSPVTTLVPLSQSISFIAILPDSVLTLRWEMVTVNLVPSVIICISLNMDYARISSSTYEAGGHGYILRRRAGPSALGSVCSQLVTHRGWPRPRLPSCTQSSIQMPPHMDDCDFGVPL